MQQRTSLRHTSLRANAEQRLLVPPGSETTAPPGHGAVDGLDPVAADDAVVVTVVDRLAQRTGRSTAVVIGRERSRLENLVDGVANRLMTAVGAKVVSNDST